MPVSPDEFRHALSRFASGVTVVTTKDSAGKLHGITVSAFCSVSLDPPLVLVCIENNAGSNYAFAESGLFAVNILTDAQAHVSEHFASTFEDKFKNAEYSISDAGIPVINDALAVIECKLQRTFDGGDHSIFIGEVENTIVGSAKPLVYFGGGYHSAAD